MRTIKTYHDSNRRAWNQAAAAYRKHMQQTVEFLRKGGASMCPPELSFLNNLEEWCNSAVHLQCAGGQDTLSLLNLGARNVTGIDISEEMINIAQEISSQLNARADWVCCDIFDTPARLNEQPIWSIRAEGR